MTAAYETKKPEALPSIIEIKFEKHGGSRSIETLIGVIAKLYSLYPRHDDNVNVFDAMTEDRQQGTELLRDYLNEDVKNCCLHYSTMIFIQ